MSKSRKQRLENLLDVIENRCKPNSELYFILLKEKQKLEKQATKKSNKKKHQLIKYQLEQRLRHMKNKEQNPRQYDLTPLSYTSKKDGYRVRSSGTMRSESERNEQVTKARHGTAPQNSKRKEEHHQQVRHHRHNRKQSSKRETNNRVADETMESLTPKNERSRYHRAKRQSNHRNKFSNHQQPDKDDAKSPSEQSVTTDKLIGSKTVKTFTKEEIDQMSRHNKKKLPTYFISPDYQRTLVKSSAEKTVPEIETSAEKLDEKTCSSSNDFATSDSQASKESAGMHKLATSNKFSPSLLKLQEKNSSGKRIRKAEKSNGRSYQSHQLPTKTSQDRASSLVGEEKQPAILEKAPESKRKSSDTEVVLKDEAKLLQGKVVFRLDMDEATEKEKKNFSFFRRKIFKKKAAKLKTSSTQTDLKVHSQSVQCDSQMIPGLLLNLQTQTKTINTTSSTQTLETASQSTPSPTSFPTKQQYSQGKSTPENNKATSRPKISLDDLVQHRKQRRAKSVINKKSQQDEIYGQLQRSATVQNTSKDKQDTKLKTKTIKAFNWSQTEKFIKIIISHNGVHLIPINNIEVKSNGLNLKVTIKEKEDLTGGNTNENNNNKKDSCTALHELSLERLSHPVVHLSYTIQPDMVTVLLRKRIEKPWKELEKVDNEDLIISAAQVYL